jgi:TRAP transporter 4TM/12TM fusion protein
MHVFFFVSQEIRLSAENMDARMTDVSSPAPEIMAEPGNRIVGSVRKLVVVMGTIGIFLAMNQVFNWNFFGVMEIFGVDLIIDTSFFYIMLGVFLSMVFITYPAHPGVKNKIPWYDWVCFALSMACAFYMAYFGQTIIQEGWETIAPDEATFLAGIICFLCLEAVRRVGGWILFSVCTFFFFYPLFAEYMPGFLWGPESAIEEFIRQHALGTESIIGLPMRVVTRLLIGFLIFGSALVITGGGEFFMAFATALLGRTRGGPAKVAIISSGFFGSLSGSVISNVVTTGQITIPTMKRTGYPATYAGAVEACASTGGALMPPVMGAVAFIMAEFLNVSYTTVVVAALVPAVLFYLALVLQADNYAARNGLKGQPPEEIPNLLDVVKSGWYYLFSLIMLIYMLIGLRIEVHAPYYATGVLLISSVLFGGKNRITLSGFIELIVDATKNIVNIVGILVGIGMIVGSLSYTGVGPAFSGELLQFSGDNVFLLLVLGAMTSFILGMGMTVSACYIFLAIVMGQAIADAGLNLVAGHLFILYWGMMSYITPPVAVAAVAASTIAGSHPMKTGLMSMRLGIILFILPFLFVFSPTLILHGEPLHIIKDVTTAVIAVWLLASAFEGWLYWMGRIEWAGFRVPVLIAAGLFLFPGWETDLGGIVVLTAIYVVGQGIKKKAAAASG